MVGASISRVWNCAMMTIVTLKDEILLLSLPMTAGTRIIAKQIELEQITQ